MKYLAVLVTGTNGSFLTPHLLKEASKLKRLLEQGCSGKIHAQTAVATQDDYISILPILGYDPSRYYNGEGSLLAARAGVHLEKDDVAFCCDFVTLKHAQEGYFFPKFGPKIILEHLSSQTVDDELGRELIREINEQLGTESIVFYPVKSYAHLMVWVGGKSKIQTVQPEEISGKSIAAYLPKGDGSNILTRCMEVASQFLQQHPINEERSAQDMAPINGIWLSRPGKAMELEKWEEQYDLRGGLIAEDGMIQGIGHLAGLTSIESLEIKGTSFKERCIARAKEVIKGLGTEDFVFAQFSAEEGDQELILKALDQSFVAPVLEYLEKSGDWKILFMNCHSFHNFPRRMPYLPIDKEIDFLIGFPSSKSRAGVIIKDASQLMPQFIKGGPWE